jgi:hypothetical protein
MGIDPAYGSSSFGIVVTQLSDNQVQVLYADEFQRPDFNDTLDTAIGLVREWWINIKILYNFSYILSSSPELGYTGIFHCIHNILESIVESYLRT